MSDRDIQIRLRMEQAQFVAAIQNAQAELQRTKAALAGTREELGAVGGKSDSLKAKIEGLKQTILSNRTAVEQSKSALADFKANIAALPGSVDRANSSLKLFKSIATGVFGGNILTAGAYRIKEAIQELITSSVDVSVQFDALENRFKAAGGSAEVGAESFEFVKRISKEMGLVFLDTASAFSGFEAAALRSGLTFGQVKKVFEDISTAAVAMHLPAERTKLVFLALEQISSKGVVSMEELRRQLGDSLPGALEIGARAMKMNTAEFMNMVKKGEVLSKDFLPKFAEQVKKEYGGSFEEATKMAQASFNRFTTAAQFFKDEIGDIFKEAAADMAKEWAKVLEGMTDGMNEHRQMITDAIDVLKETILKTVELIGKTIEAVGPIVLQVTTIVLDSINQILDVLTKLIDYVNKGIDGLKSLRDKFAEMGAAGATKGAEGDWLQALLWGKDASKYLEGGMTKIPWNDESKKIKEGTMDDFTLGLGNQSTSGTDSEKARKTAEKAAKSALKAWTEAFKEKLEISKKFEEAELAYAITTEENKGSKENEIHTKYAKQRVEIAKKTLEELGVSKLELENKSATDILNLDVKTLGERGKLAKEQLTDSLIEVQKYAKESAKIQVEEQKKANKKMLDDWSQHLDDRLKYNEMFYKFQEASQPVANTFEAKMKQVQDNTQFLLNQINVAKSALQELGVAQNALQARAGQPLFIDVDKYSEEIRPKIRELVQFINDSQLQVLNNAKNMNEQVQENFQQKWQAIGGYIRNVFDIITNKALTWKEKMLQILNSVLQALAKFAFSKMSGMGGGLGIFGNLLGGFFGFADGGIVPGAYGQEQIAKVHGREMVLNPVQQTSLWKMINSGQTTGGTTPKSSDDQDNRRPVVLVTFNINSLEPQTAAKLVREQMPYIKGQIIESMQTETQMRNSVKGALR